MEYRKNDIVKQLMKKHNYTKVAATELINDFTDIIIENLRRGDSVALVNFGTFDIVERKEHTCPSIENGEKIIIPAHLVPKFSPALLMRQAVKLYEDDCIKGIK